MAHHSDLKKLEGGLPLLKACVDLSTAEVKDVGGFQEALLKLVAEIKALRIGQTLMVPGGWDGNIGSSTVVHLLERTSGKVPVRGLQSPHALLSDHRLHTCR